MSLPFKAVDECARCAGALAVYADGELDASHGADLEAHLATCSACRERLTLLRAVRLSLKRATARRCSDALRARVSFAAAQGAQRSSATSAAGHATRAGDDATGAKLLRLHGGLGFAIVAGVVFGMIPWMVSPGSRSLDRPGHADVASAMTGFDILDNLVALHANPLPPETTDPADLPRLDPFVGVPVRRPPLQPFGASFEGARVHAMADRRAALLEYTVGGGHRVTVYVFNARVVPLKAMPLEPRVVNDHAVYVGNLRGYAIAAAEQRDVGYAIASDLGTDESAELVLAAIGR